MGFFETGNSGSSLMAAVIKRGPGCRQEGAFCQHLGPIIAPNVLELTTDGYIMEFLIPAGMSGDLAIEIERDLELKVWNRPALPITTEIPWQEKLQIYGVKIPDYSVVGDSCLAHGDPTASNAMRRNRDFPLVMCDPRPPRDFIPQCRETDYGRILQSILGWEVAAYGAEPVNWAAPKFLNTISSSNAAYFWCGAAAARIEYLERSRANRDNILKWCKRVRKICDV